MPIRLVISVLARPFSSGSLLFVGLLLGTIAGSSLGIGLRESRRGHFFFDLARNRAEFFTGMSIRLIEGLSLFGSFNAELIQDQLHLPAGDASLDEILLRRRDLATNYEIDASIGFSYTRRDRDGPVPVPPGAVVGNLAGGPGTVPETDQALDGHY